MIIPERLVYYLSTIHPNSQPRDKFMSIYLYNTKSPQELNGRKPQIVFALVIEQPLINASSCMSASLRNESRETLTAVGMSKSSSSSLQTQSSPALLLISSVLSSITVTGRLLLDFFDSAEMIC